jgi:SNF2 family DNA or RNA helicase
MLNDNVVGLFLEMGLGKTVIALTAIKELRYNTFDVRKVLVIAPKKVAESTWVNESSKWTHLKILRVVPVLGSERQRLAALDTASDVYVINRENVLWLVTQYKADWPFDMVIIDESSSFKNHKAKRFKALTWVRKYINRVVLLSGTPAPNGLLDLWAQIYLLDCGERLEKRIGQYREKYFSPGQTNGHIVYSYALKPNADKIIWEQVRDICVSMKAKDYIELPDCNYITHAVKLDALARKTYDDFKRKSILELGETTIDASTAAVLSNKLLQMCNGAVYNFERNVEEIHTCKLEAFSELVEALNGEAAIVFYNYQHDLPRLRGVLKGDLRVRELKTPQDEKDWNAGKVDILLAHPASAAYGLNLQDGGHHAIWFGMNWSLELYLQANKRLHRQGQKHKVFIHHVVVKGCLDEDVEAVLGDKEVTQNKLLEALKYHVRNL